MARGSGDGAGAGWVEEDEVGCRLLLPWPPGDLAKALPEGITSLAGLIVDPAIRPPTADDLEQAHALGAALFVRDGIEAAALLGADGVLLDASADPEAARSRLARDALIGALCGTSRHAAMVAGEAGADYVVLGRLDGIDDVDALAELASWWREIFVLPVAVCGIDDLAQAKPLVDAGADFLLLTSSLWDDPEAARDLVLAIDRLLVA